MTNEPPLPAKKPANKPANKVDPLWILSRIPIVLIIGLFIAFALQNSESSQVDFLQWSFRAPRVVTLIAAAILGALVRDLMRYRSNKRSRVE